MEFAIDDVKKLQLRKAKLEADQRGAGEDSNIQHRNVGTHSPITNMANKKQMKRRREDVSEAGKQNEVLKDGATSRDDGANKKQKCDPAGVNPKEAPSEKNSSRNKRKSKSQNWKGKDENDKKSKSSRKVEATSSSKGEMQKLKPQMKQKQLQVEDGHAGQRKRPKKMLNKGGDVVDKLDKLIEQYRSKFTHKSSNMDGGKQGSKQLRRWFQS